MDLRKGKIEGQFDAIKFIDKDTKQAVIYVPAVELSGYGEDFNKAAEILKFNINEFFEYLSHLSTDDAHTELIKLGWKRKIFNKQFSNTAINFEEAVKHLNADEKTIQRVTLNAA